MDKNERYLFIGVGGMGMAPLAAWMSEAGYSISGYDDNLQERVRIFLAKSAVLLEDFIFPEQLSRYTTVVYSSAVSRAHPLLNAAHEQGLSILRRGELLAKVAAEHRLIAIVGSHGKTTTCGMIAHGIRRCGIDANYILGGFFSNPSVPASHYSESDWLVAEVDESDGTIEEFSPELTVVLNVDWDHADLYSNRQMLDAAFRDLVMRTTNKVFTVDALLDRFETATQAEVKCLESLASSGVEPPSVGKFNQVNGAAALSVLKELTAAPLPTDILSGFSGMARRQTVLHHDVQALLVEDYAHHPTEIEALIECLRSMEPERKLVVVFQAHRYSRTRQFKDAFATALSQSDQVFLLPVYAAHEEVVDGGRLVNLSMAFGVNAPPVLSKDLAGMHQLANSLEEVPTTLAFVGAGDVDQFGAAFTSLMRCGFELDDAWEEFLQGRVSRACVLRRNEALANKTTIRVGGNARLYAEPANLTDLLTLLRSAKLFSLETFCLGRGSNLVVPDEGFNGLVIRFNAGIWRSSEALGEGRVWVAAGVRLKEVCGFAAKHGLSGFEFLEGIPGSVGGALRMNAGAMGSWMFDVVERVQFIDDSGQMQDLPKEAFHFGYRKVEEISSGIALGAVLTSHGHEPEALIRERIESFSSDRKSSQPRDPSAGCIFKNPDGNFAGKLVDQYGIKGMRVGDAEVSDVHGNFIVNRGKASATDVIELVRQVRAAVFKKSGYLLEPEVLLLGRSWEEVLGPIEEGAVDV